MAFLAVVILLLIGIILSLWLTYFGPPSFQPTTVQADPGAIAPAHAYILPQHVRVIDVAYGPGSDSLYVYLEVHAVNLWSALVYQWPEIAVLMLSLGVLWLTVRLMRRGSGENEPHCRGCGYLLLHLESQKCPECGLELTSENRVTPRRSRWRLVIPLVALALVGLCYHSIKGRWRWRTPEARDAMYWPSLRAYHWGNEGSKSRRNWADNNECYVYQVLEIDPNTGVVKRSLLRQTDDLRPWQKIVTSHDEQRMAILHGRYITVINTETNRSVVQLTASNTEANVLNQFFYMAEFSRDGRHLYTAAWEKYITKWDLRTGEAVVQFDLPDVFAENLETAIIRDIHELDGDEGVMFLGHTYDVATKLYDGFILRTDSDLEHTRKFSVIEEIQVQVMGAAVTTDHIWMSGWGMKAFVIPRDDSTPIRYLAKDQAWPWFMAFSRDSRFAALDWQPRGGLNTWALELLSTNDLEILATIGNNTIVPFRADFSSDGRHLAVAISFYSNNWTSGLMIIDLESIEP